MREARTPRRVSPHAVRCCAIQQMRTATIQHSASGNETMSGEVSDPACSMPAAAVLDAFAHMLVARTLSRAASLNPRASVLPHTQQMSAAMIQHSASGDATESGEVSDPGCSRPAAAMLDARARMFTAQTLSRDASLTLRCSLLCHIQLSGGSITSEAGSEEMGDPLQRTVWQRARARTIALDHL